MSQELTEEQRGVISRAEKMLKLAAGNQNENEARVATEKAMALLAAYNLDVAAVEREGGADGKREEAKVAGGLYHWQRDLWQRVAELNFCYYFTLNQWDKTKKRRVKLKYGDDGYVYGENRTKVVTGGYRFEHKLIGRVVNTRSTIAMAQYLEGEIERLTRERFNIGAIFTQPAIVYREGMADEVCHKLYNARRQLLNEEKRKQEEAYERAKTQGTVPPGFQMTLASYTTAEEEANDDFMYGEGYTAKRKEMEARQAEARRIAREEQTRWAAENPEEAARLAKEQEEESRKYWARRRGGGGGSTPQERRRSEYGSYYRAGQEKGENISIHKQADGKKVSGLLK